MKRSLLALPLLTLAGLGAQAQTAPAAAEAKSPWSFTGNAGVFSDYRFRGISQTNKKPAFQGGFDVGHASGFYAGNWNSNVDSRFFNGANLEMDFYGGYKLPVGPLALDFGALYYYYPGSGAGGTFKIDNTELYIGAGWGPVSVKYSHAISDFFGVSDSKNSWYLEANGSYDLGKGFGLVGHVGYQKLKGNARLIEMGSTTLIDNVADWKVGVTYDLSGFILGASYVGTNRDLTGGTAALANRNISDGTVVVSVSKSF
ncbi:MAG: TorF family putative porin [Caldimonas sp.]